LALLVPHAGYEYSGRTAARAYGLLSPGRWDSVVVLGTGHYKEVEGAAIYPGPYGTPEGSVPYDEGLARELLKEPLFSLDPEAHLREHSVEVQVPFLRRRLGAFKLVAMVINTPDLEKARAIGRALAKAVRGRRALLVASSDLSHYPPALEARAVDQTTLEALATLDPDYFWLANRILLGRGIGGLDVAYCGQAAVAAVMVAAAGLGATEARVLELTNSGEAAPGHDSRVVGYAAVAFVRAGKKKPKAVFHLPEPEKQELLRLARRQISEYLATGTFLPVPLSANPRFNLPAAVFVTLRRRDGKLRGCVGSLEARESLAESVARNAVASAVADKRFPPLSAQELPEVRLSIDLLSRPAAVRGSSEIRPGDGVILERDGRVGVFLPQVWETLSDKQRFLEELCSQKAELPRECYKEPRTRLKVFTADYFEEKPSP